MKAARTALTAGMLILTVVSACTDGGGALPGGGWAATTGERGYRLVVLDSEREVRRRCTGEAAIPWVEGMTGSRCESTLLASKEGFILPEAFLEQWRDALTTFLVEYGQTDGSTYRDFGWVLRRSPGGAEEVSIQFKEPLGFDSPEGGRITTTAEAYVMKRDAISLFDPRGREKGKPELEGHVTATLVCDHVTRSGDALRFDYDLRIRGEGVMRFFGATGEEWILGEEDTFHLDREETCEIAIDRRGMKAFSRDRSGTWSLDREAFEETWHAESLESEAMVHESSLSGAGRTYTLTPSDLPARGAPAVAVFDVRDFGAVGDGETPDTAAIQASIDACSAQGGGTVRFPPGVFLSGSIHMKSHLTLKLERGAVLRGTRAMNAYDPREETPWREYQDSSQSCIRHSLIWGENLEDVAVVGPGIIDGSDAFDPWPGMDTSPPPPYGWVLSTLMYQIDDELFERGAKPIAFKSCRNILIKDVTIVHAPDESIFVAGCDSVLIDGYTAREVRVDGIDPVCCRDVTITNSEIKSLDDAIAIKSSYMLGYRRSCERVLVENCLLSTFINALKIGTESVGDFRDIVLRDCTVQNLPGFPSFAGLSMMSVDGGRLDGIVCANIRMRNPGYPIFIRLGDRLRSPETLPIGEVGEILIRNVTAVGGAGLGASLITAVPGSLVAGRIRLQDLDITCPGGGRLAASLLPVPEVRESDGVYPDPPYIVPGEPPAYGFFCRHVRDLSFQDVRVGFDRPDRRAALVCEDVRGLELDGFEAERIPDGAPSVILRE